MKDLKQKVFALYWGQEILMVKLQDDFVLKQVNSAWIEGFNKPCYLNVTPLHLITDEHAIEVADILGEKIKPNTVRFIKDIISYLDKPKRMPLDIHPLYYLQIIDYLRSHGYALEAFGNTVDSLISQEIFKLKEAC